MTSSMSVTLTTTYGDTLFISWRNSKLAIQPSSWMGIMDWTRENIRMNQSTQAMHLATALASWIIWIANADHANMSGVVIE